MARSAFLNCCVFVALCGGLSRGERIVVPCDASALAVDAFRDQHVAADATQGVRLARSYLITNETGVTGKFFDDFGPAESARISFDIPTGGFDRAVLLIYNSYTYKDRRPATIAVNGTKRPYVHDEARTLGSGWARHDIAADELKAGRNEIVVTGAGLHVDTFSHIGRSARSFDGGKTFKVDKLGPAGEWSGEYIVRLRVYGHPPGGEVTSPIIDPAVVPDDPRIRPRVAVRELTLHPEQTLPGGTRIGYAIRSGTTPSPTGRTWSEWRSIDPGQPVSMAGDRYLQWRAQMTTDSSSRSPSLRAVRLELEADVAHPRMNGVQVLSYENPTIVRSSYPFTWESDAPRVRYLREKYKLSDVVREGADELTRQNNLRKWVSSQWKEHWDLGKYGYCPPWDALQLLEMAPLEFSEGMCTHFACTYVQTAAAVGFNSRTLISDHHCLTEVWSNQLGKWVLQDPGPGRGPEGYPIGFAYQADGTWLNALDVHNALREKRAVTAITDSPAKPAWTLDEAWMSLFSRFAIPLRNNHLSQAEPAEVEHGRETYRWDGYLWWTDDLDSPKYPEFSLLSNRPGDFYWTLNRVVVDLQQDGDYLIVNLDSDTPNLSRYEAAIDGGQYTQVNSGMKWTLHDGQNRLSVRSVNGFGIQGPASTVVVARNSKQVK